MTNNKKYLIFIILYLISWSAVAATTKLNGMVVLSNDNGVFSAVINLDNQFKGEYVTIRDGYVMDYYRYNVDHSNTFSNFDIKIAHKKDRSFVLIKSLTPLNHKYDLVLRLISNKHEVLGIYKAVNEENVNYIANEINKDSMLEENKNKQLDIVKNNYEWSRTQNSKLETASQEVMLNKVQNELFATECYYSVKGDNLTKIAKKMLANSSYKNEINLKQLINKIYELNLKAFIKGDINRLKQNYCLVVPKLDSLADKNHAENTDLAVINVSINKTKISNIKPQESNQQKKENQEQQVYHVIKGDCLSTISMKLKEVFPGRTWREIMKIIYNNNSKHFIKGDINLIRAGVTLKITNN